MSQLRFLTTARIFWPEKISHIKLANLRKISCSALGLDWLTLDRPINDADINNRTITTYSSNFPPKFWTFVRDSGRFLFEWRATGSLITTWWRILYELVIMPLLTTANSQSLHYFFSCFLLHNFCFFGNQKSLFFLLPDTTKTKLKKNHSNVEWIIV